MAALSKHLMVVLFFGLGVVLFFAVLRLPILRADLRRLVRCGYDRQEGARQVEMNSCSISNENQN